MSWESVLIIISGSSVGAALLTSGFSFFLERYKTRKEEETERKKLYSLLYFYLKLIRVNHQIRDELWDDRQKTFQERHGVSSGKEKGALLIQNLDDTREYRSKLINDSWTYIDLVKKSLEENPRRIRIKDWFLVERFFKAYFLREMLVGKAIYKDTTHIFSDQKIEEASTSLLEALDEMYGEVILYVETGIDATRNI